MPGNPVGAIHVPGQALSLGAVGDDLVTQLERLVSVAAPTWELIMSDDIRGTEEASDILVDGDPCFAQTREGKVYHGCCLDRGHSGKHSCACGYTW